MAVNFYRKNKRRGKEIASMGYGKFNFIRDIFTGCWNPKFAFLCYIHPWLDSPPRFADANPPLPDELVALASQPDCEGELTAEEVASLVRVLESNATFMERRGLEHCRDYVGKFDKQHFDNDWMNDPEWREEAHKFYLMLKDCAKRKCGIEWF